MIWSGIKILLACLIVGIFLSMFDFDPIGLLRFLGQSLRDSLDFASEAVHWSLQYIIVGAIVVIPIVLIRWGLRQGRRRD